MGVYSMESVKGLGHVQTVWAGKDNPIECVLKEDGQDYDFSGAQAVRVKIGDVLLDSEMDRESFDLSEAAVGRIKVFIGDHTLEPHAYPVGLELDDSSGRTLYFGTVRVHVRDPKM